MTITDGFTSQQDTALSQAPSIDKAPAARPTHRTSSGLTLAPVTKAPVNRRGGPSLKPTVPLSVAVVGEDSEDWETPEAPVLTPSSGDWGDDDEDAEGDWGVTPTRRVSPSPVTAPVTPMVETLSPVIPTRPVSPTLSTRVTERETSAVEETPVAAVTTPAPKAVSKKASTPRGPAGTPLPTQRKRAGEATKRARPAKRPRLQARDFEVLELLAVMRVTTAQHLIMALESRESQYAVMESTSGMVPLSPYVLEKRLSLLERAGFVKRFYPSAFSRSRPCWLSTGKGISVTSLAGEIAPVNTRSTAVLETSLAHHLTISAEIGRLKGAIAVPDVVVKKALSSAMELARPGTFTPEWDAAWMQPFSDAAHLAPCDRFASPIEPDLTVVDAASNTIAYYVEVECSPKSVEVYETKMRAYGAAGIQVVFLVGTTAQAGASNVVHITRRLEKARANLGLSEDLIRIEKSDLSWGHPDPAAHRAAELGRVA